MVRDDIVVNDALCFATLTVISCGLVFAMEGLETHCAIVTDFVTRLTFLDNWRALTVLMISFIVTSTT